MLVDDDRSSRLLKGSSRTSPRGGGADARWPGRVGTRSLCRLSGLLVYDRDNVRLGP